MCLWVLTCEPERLRAPHRGRVPATAPKESRLRRFLSLASLTCAAAGALWMTGDACAAGTTAQYAVRFDATWSSTSHPIGFPASAHFSPLIGGTHDASVQFWAVGAVASPGIRDMAERGLTAPLSNEVQGAINTGHAGAVILGGAVSPSPGTAGATFGVSQQFSRVSLVTMVAPSPDWFVGVNGLDLWVDGHWVDRVTVPLYAFDAGTDSGVDYTSANQVTVPPVPIAPGSAAAFQNGTPLGLYTFTRTDAPNPAAVPAAGGASLLGLGALMLALGGAAVARSRQRKRPA